MQSGNRHAQLKGDVCALATPAKIVISNWAYMVMTSLARILKDWRVLWLMAEEETADSKKLANR